VIAIIGILSSVVLASLQTARQKGADAAIKSTINNARAEAELWYDGQTPNAYTRLCGELLDAKAAVNNAGGRWECIVNVAGDEYRISSQLVSTTDYYCVDSSGAAVQGGTAPSGEQCP
jgi:type II secretory pathway pseudopilin PulG